MTACDLRAYQTSVISTVLGNSNIIFFVQVSVRDIHYLFITKNYNNVPACNEITNARRHRRSV